MIESLDQPVRAIVIAHAHTDNYGGLVFFRQRFPGVPIYASRAVRDEMRDDVVPDNATAGDVRLALFDPSDDQRAPA